MFFVNGDRVYGRLLIVGAGFVVDTEMEVVGTVPIGAAETVMVVAVAAAMIERAVAAKS